MIRPSLLHCSACLTLAFGLSAGCTGQVAGPGNPGTQGTGSRAGTGNASGTGSTAGTGNTNGGGGVGGPGAPAGDPLAAGIKPLRILTAREYVNTVRDLLGETALTESALPVGDEDPNVTPSFAFRQAHPIAPQDGSLFQSTAETVARNAVGRLTTILPCAAPTLTGAAATTCLGTFLTTFMPKMYRRPLSSGMSGEADPTNSPLAKLYNLGRTTLSLDFNGAIGLLIEAGLQSPQFLYHWEREIGLPTATPEPGGVIKLGNYELANRLSYFVWGSMPDAPLFAAAAGGQLNTAANVETQVRRMLKDGKATSSLVNFFSDWLDVDGLQDMPKDTGMYPMFNDVLTAAMTSEFESLVTGVVTTGSGRLTDLLTGTNSFANQPLAAFYGIAPVTGTALKPVMLNPMQRAGLLTTGAFLATTGDTAESNPPRRGKAIYTKLMCGVMGIPPADVPTPKPASAGGTMRQRMEEHDALNAACAASCHSIIEPLGFAFEEYGGIGEFRTIDNNAPVNSTGTVTLDGVAHPYSNAPDLVKLLAASPTVQRCFTTQWLRYGFGRPETPADQASLNEATTAFAAATSDVRELIVALAKSRTFLYRTPSLGEKL
jgi:hypothetical protein